MNVHSSNADATLESLLYKSLADDRYQSRSRTILYRLALRKFNVDRAADVRAFVDAKIENWGQQELVQVTTNDFVKLTEAGRIALAATYADNA